MSARFYQNLTKMPKNDEICCNYVPTKPLFTKYASLITFCVSRRRRKMYCGHPRLCVCVSVRGRMPTLLYGPVEW